MVESIRTKVLEIVQTNEKANVITSVSILDMSTGHMVVHHNTDTEQFAASVNKAPVCRLLLSDLREAKLHFSQPLSWPKDMVLAGTGYYDQPGAPLTANLQDLLFDMLNRSGNTAVNVFVQTVLGGAKVVNDRFRDELQLNKTYLEPLHDGNFYLGNTVSTEAMASLQALHSGDDVFQQFVLDALSTDIFTDYGVSSQLEPGTDRVVMRKVGFLNDPSGNNRHDAGLVFANGELCFAYAILTTSPGEEYTYPTAQAGVSLARVGDILLGN